MEKKWRLNMNVVIIDVEKTRSNYDTMLSMFSTFNQQKDIHNFIPYYFFICHFVHHAFNM